MIYKEISNIDKNFIKFLFVGAINTFFGYSVFAVFLFIGFHYSLAALFSTIIGILFNFKTTGSLVFKNKNNKLIFKFIGVYGITYLVNIVFLSIFNYFKINMYIAGLVLVFFCALISFMLMRRFVFTSSVNKSDLGCLICKNDDTKQFDAVFSDFIKERVFNGLDKDVKLIKCNNCGFSYFDYRLSEKECTKLYKNYRDDNYQKQRQKYECWYSKEINNLIGKSSVEIINRNNNLSDILKNNIDISKINSVLDFGGDKGQFIPKILKNTRKFLYEISGAETKQGVKLLNSTDECKENEYDLVICTHVLEHVAFPQQVIEIISSFLKKGQYLYIELPFDSPFYKSSFSMFQFIFNKYFLLLTLIKQYLYLKKFGQKYIMNEHINYFTPQSAEILLEENGFKILHSSIKDINTGWNKTRIISVLSTLK